MGQIYRIDTRVDLGFRHVFLLLDGKIMGKIYRSDTRADRKNLWGKVII